MATTNGSKVQVNLKVMGVVVSLFIGVAVLLSYFTGYVNARIDEKAYPAASGTVLETKLDAMAKQLDRIEEKLK